VNINEMREIVALCKFYEYDFKVTEGHGGIHLQATYMDRDVSTGLDSLQYTRKWLLSPMMTKSELVQTAFKLCQTSYEHRTREGFKYKGKRVFGPHFNVDALHGLCVNKQYDYRPEDPHQQDTHGDT
jgi:hypothetical protein